MDRVTWLRAELTRLVPLIVEYRKKANYLTLPTHVRARYLATARDLEGKYVLYKTELENRVMVVRAPPPPPELVRMVNPPLFVRLPDPKGIDPVVVAKSSDVKTLPDAALTAKMETEAMPAPATPFYKRPVVLGAAALLALYFVTRPGATNIFTSRA